MSDRSIFLAHRVFFSFAVALLLVCVFGCSSSDSPDSVGSAQPSLTVSANPSSVPADGSAAILSISAVESPGHPGAGIVQLQAPRGVLDGGGNTKTATLTNGLVDVAYACNEANDPLCVGAQTVTVRWASLVKTVSVTFTGNGADGGTDGGTDAEPDAESDSGPDVSDDAPTDTAADSNPASAALSLVAVDTTMFSDVGDHAVLRATLLDKPDGGPLAGQEIVFSTNIGLMANPSGAPPDPADTITLTTDSSGIAEAWLTDNGTTGFATVTATHTLSGSSAQANVEILAVQQITHVSTTCNGSACTIMGIKGSGFNEQAQVTFQVVDSSNHPAPGVNVSFSIANPPPGTTVTPSAVTNAQGRVTANVSAGKVIGAFTVKATVIPGLVEVESPTIGIRGAKPANKGFSLTCSPVNVGAYVSPTPPKAFDVNCNVKLVDRYNNPVGTGTSVNFKAEAGSIPNSIATKAYQATGSNTDEGEGTVVFSTVGAFPPVDVDPLPADAAQVPTQREAEPTYPDGVLTRNPRDGLVTIIAYVRGEEFFADDNNNGTRDPDEQFIDQGEPFVDSNDNGVRDPGEVYIDEAPADGQWNPPNGGWDDETSIWVETHVLYTGIPAYPTIIPTGWSLHVGEVLLLDSYFPDINGNRPQASGTSFAISHQISKGTVSLNSTTILDGYGFGLDRLLVDATTKLPCSPTSQVCRWSTLFTTWSLGYCVSGTIKGANNTAGAPDTGKIEATVLSNKVSALSDGMVY